MDAIPQAGTFSFDGTEFTIDPERGLCVKTVQSRGAKIVDDETRTPELIAEVDRVLAPQTAALYFEPLLDGSLVNKKERACRYCNCTQDLARGIQACRCACHPANSEIKADFETVNTRETIRTAAAVRTAKAICGARPDRMTAAEFEWIAKVLETANIIDRETGLPELIEALRTIRMRVPEWLQGPVDAIALPALAKAEGRR
jgi:hypothetical protein